MPTTTTFIKSAVEFSDGEVTVNITCGQSMSGYELAFLRRGEVYTREFVREGGCVQSAKAAARRIASQFNLDGDATDEVSRELMQLG